MNDDQPTKPPREGNPEAARAFADLVAQGLLRPPTASAALSAASLQVEPPELRARCGARLGAGASWWASTVALRHLAAINEIYGPSLGDSLRELLVAVLEAVLEELDPGACFAHVAGCQYVVLHGDSVDVTAFSERLLTAVAGATLLWRGAPVRPRPVLATVQVPGAGGWQVDDLLTLLGALRGEAERADKETVLLRADSAQVERLADVRRRASALDRISRAIEEDRIDVHFQPVVDVGTGALVKVEALARINDGERELAANDFIDLLYDVGEIVELDRRVFRWVRKHAARLAAVSPQLLINVSPLSLTSPAFRAEMHDSITAVQAEGFELMVVLELTEQALIDQQGFLREVHRDHGVTFAVDDFGTGYSSLQTVADLAISGVVSCLKVDGSLTRRLPESSEVYKVFLAIANLSRSLDLTVVAEHVENEEILAHLRTTGVPLAQGHYFGRPLPLAELEAAWARSAQAASPTAVVRGRLHVLEPYLDKALNAFYDTLLSDHHFAPFFSGPGQVRSLVERQRASFLASLAENETALRARYDALGRTHHAIGIPFPTYMKGTSILNNELLEVLATVTNDGSLVQDTQRFFAHLADLMAKGYLESIIAEDRASLARLGRRGGNELPCLARVVTALATGQATDLAAFAAGDCPAERWIAHSGANGHGARLALLHRRIHGDAASIAYFLEHEEYASLLLVYHAVRGHFMELAALLG